ncbi:MAG: class II glutamine amidotransferase [Caulobacteraceae bacterium]
MCELFGLSCNCVRKATQSLYNFAEHSCRNPHGWGIAYYKDSEAILKKMPEEARSSPDFYRVAETAESNIIISHIRNASCGEQHERNCHPFKRVFQGKSWVFAHNGHVDGVARHPRALGETDSESVFNMLLDSIEEYSSSGSGTEYSGLVAGISGIFTNYEYGRDVKLNFVMSEGTDLYAFNHHPQKPMYYARSSSPHGDYVIVSTQMLDGIVWERLPEDKLLLVRDGKVMALSERI